MLDGLPTLTCSADVFSLGMTLLETATGNVPYPELKDPAVCTAILVKKQIPSRPEVHIPTKSKRDDMLWLLLEQCWAFEPEHRPNAEQVRDEMLKIVNVAPHFTCLPQSIDVRTPNLIPAAITPIS